jgi:hypothetical protein
MKLSRFLKWSSLCSVFALTSIQFALACGTEGMHPPDYKLPSFNTMADEEFVRGYPEEVIRGAAYILHGDANGPTFQDWDFSGEAGANRFFAIVRELEILRLKGLPAKSRFYVEGGYSLGTIELMLKWPAWDAIKKLPIIDNNLPGTDEPPVDYADLSKGTGIASLDSLFQKFEATRVYPYDWYEPRDPKFWGGRVYITTPNKWLDPFAFRQLADQATENVLRSNFNQTLCGGIPQLVKWEAPSVYSYTDRDTWKKTYYRVDAEQETVTKLDAAPIVEQPVEFKTSQGVVLTRSNDEKLGSAWVTKGVVWSLALEGHTEDKAVAQKMCEQKGGRLPTLAEYQALAAAFDTEPYRYRENVRILSFAGRREVAKAFPTMAGLNYWYAEASANENTIWTFSMAAGGLGTVYREEDYAFVRCVR